MSMKLDELERTFDAAREDLLDALLERAGEVARQARGGLTKLHFSHGWRRGEWNFTAYGPGDTVMSHRSHETIAGAIEGERLGLRIAELLAFGNREVTYNIPVAVA